MNGMTHKNFVSFENFFSVKFEKKRRAWEMLFLSAKDLRKKRRRSSSFFGLIKNRQFSLLKRKTMME